MKLGVKKVWIFENFRENSMELDALSTNRKITTFLEDDKCS
jgi:hypothetical protein